MIRMYRWLMFGLAVAGVIPKTLDLFAHIDKVTARDIFLVLDPVFEAFARASGIPLPLDLVTEILQVVITVLRSFYGKSAKTRTDQANA